MGVNDQTRIKMLEAERDELRKEVSQLATFVSAVIEVNDGSIILPRAALEVESSNFIVVDLPNDGGVKIVRPWLEEGKMPKVQSL